MSEIKSIQDLFNQYRNARRHREHEEVRAKGILKPLQDALKATKELLYRTVNLYKEMEAKNREQLENLARATKELGGFGEKARYQLDGGYIEVQAKKKVVRVQDLQAFLDDPAAKDLIVSIKVNEAVIKLMNRVPDGITIEKLPGIFKASISKETK